MPEYSAGEARASYDLDITRFNRAIDQAIARYDALAKAAATATARSSLPAPTLPQPTIPRPAPTQQPASTGADNNAADAAAKRARSIREVEQALARQAAQERLALRQSQALADSEIRAARASGDHERALRLIDTQLGKTAQDTVRYNNLLAQQARAQSALKGADLGPALPRTFAGLTPDVAAAAANMLSFGAAVGVASQAAQSFAQAYTFKTQLDATNASIAIQLRGIRDSADVFAAANRYAEQYKLTQQETSDTIQASIGILRTSQSSVEDTFSVLQRLTVLAPGKSIQDAAFSVRELASGDITSIAEQFNISRKQAYAMRDAIVNGADVVQVLSGYLDTAGISMDNLRAQTEGAVGKMRDLKIAQEQVQLAQADVATSAGIETGVDIQIAATRGLARVLNGELIPSWDELTVKARVYQDAYQKAMAQGLGPFAAQQAAFLAIADSATVAAAAQDFYAERTAAAQTAGDAERTRTYQQAVDNLGAALEANAIDTDTYRATVAELGNAYQQAVIGAQAQQGATDANAGATQNATGQTVALTDATKALIQQHIENAAQTQISAGATAGLVQFQTDLANISDAVKNGLFTDAEAASYLSSKYGEAANNAIFLIRQQAQLALGEKRLADQRAAQAKGGGILAPDGIGFDSPGRTGTSDVDSVVRTIQQVQNEAAQAEQDKIQAAADAAAAAEEARRRQIEQTGTAAQRAALYQQEYNEAVKQFGKDSAQAIDAETKLKQLQSQGRPSGGGGRAPRAPSTPRATQNDVDAAQDVQARLDDTNRLLAAGNLSQAERNRLVDDQRKLEAQITDEKRAQQRAALDAAQAANDDAQKRLVEAREVRGLQNQAVNARASEEERAAARLRLEEIALDQQQRAADIEEKRRKAGGVPLPETAAPTVPPEQLQAQQDALAEQRRLNEQQQRQLAEQQRLQQQPIPGVTAPLPLTLPDLTQLPPIQLPTLQAPPVTVNLSITLDKDGNVIRDQVDPGAILRILGTQSVAQNLMGGR